MKNKVLEEIKEFAQNKLIEAYGYCGVASGDNAAMLNTSDKQGNDIEVTIELKPE